MAMPVVVAAGLGLVRPWPWRWMLRDVRPKTEARIDKNAAIDCVSEVAGNLGFPNVLIVDEFVSIGPVLVAVAFARRLTLVLLFLFDLLR